MTWTDEKIDALDGKVDALDKKVDTGFARLDKRMEVESVRNDERFNAVGERFEDVDRRFEEVDRRFDKLEGETKAGFEALNTKFDAKFDAFNRTMIQVGGGLIGTMIVALITVLVAFVATQT